MLSHVLEPRRGVRPHQTIVRAENFDRDRIHLDPPFLVFTYKGMFLISKM